MTRVLVTGGSGFIGRTLVPGLELLGYEVLAPRHAELELVDADAVRAYLARNRPDVVVHSATKPGHRNASDLSGIIEANERMFFNLVRDRELCPRMVFVGSGAVYDARHYRHRMPETYFDAHVPSDHRVPRSGICSISPYLRQVLGRLVTRVSDSPSPASIPVRRTAAPNLLAEPSP